MFDYDAAAVNRCPHQARYRAASGGAALMLRGTPRTRTISYTASSTPASAGTKAAGLNG